MVLREADTLNRLHLKEKEKFVSSFVSLLIPAVTLIRICLDLQMNQRKKIKRFFFVVVVFGPLFISSNLCDE